MYMHMGMGMDMGMGMGMGMGMDMHAHAYIYAFTWHLLERRHVEAVREKVCEERAKRVDLCSTHTTMHTHLSAGA